jgi:anaerobic magnesium-protoporphyrin IX monomethyl ester cyclase
LEIYWNKKRTPNTLKYVTQKYSIFDFLRGLGVHFVERKPFHQYALTDVFEILSDYVGKYYEKDVVLRELIAIDYYLFHKMKPKTLFLEEVERAEKYALLNELRLNHQKYRFIVLPLHFNFEVFEKSQVVDNQLSMLIIQYAGTSKPVLIRSELGMKEF